MKIILVDDEKHNLEDLSECVAELRPNAEIFSFDRSAEALSFTKENDVDVAFLDIRMPLMNGIELAKELKKVSPKINVIFCTAFSQYVLDALRLHASGYINKPYSPADVKRELDNLLHPTLPPSPRIFARTFGDFDLFLNGVAVTFKRAKSKELLAYLIYKRGGMITKKELAAVLLGDDYSAKTQNYVAKIYGDLAKDLREVGLESILCKAFNQYGVDVRAFSCDYYDFIEGKPSGINSYEGEFFAQYEWGVL